MNLCFEKKHYCTHLKSWNLLESCLWPYLIDGLHKNEKVHYYTDRFTPKEILQFWPLSSEQKNILEVALANGNLEIYSGEQVYMTDGQFNIDDRLNFAKIAIAKAQAEGFSGFRIATEMEWIKKATNANIIDLVSDYEMRCNDFFDSNFITCLCIYCDESLTPDLCFRALHAHPQVHALNQTTQEIFNNPFMNKSGPDPLHDLRHWIRYLKSMGLNWIAHVDSGTKTKFKSDVYQNLAKYIEGNGFSQKGIPDIFLNISAL